MLSYRIQVVISIMDNRMTLLWIFCVLFMLPSDHVVFGQVTCGGSLSASTGEITSPGYPDLPYGGNYTCIWMIEAPVGMSVELSIDTFDIEESEECDKDHLTIYDISQMAELLPTACGRTIPWPPFPTLVTTENAMRIVFEADGDATTNVGFQATYRHVSPRVDFLLAVDAGRDVIYQQNLLGADRRSWSVSGHPVAIDYDPIDEIIYFTDNERNFISTIDIHTGIIENIVTTGILDPQGLAVDFISRQLYWTDSGARTITVSYLAGNVPDVIVSTGISQPRDIVVQQGLGSNIFWSDTGSAPKLERSDKDGNNRLVLVNSDLGEPIGLYLDEVERKLYWIDAVLERVEGCYYDGSERTVLSQFSFDFNPFGLIVRDDTIYWTDGNLGGIVTVRRNFQDGPQTSLIGGQSSTFLGLTHFSSTDPLCSFLLRHTEGTITIPDVTRNYNWGSLCSWTIEAPLNMVVEFHIEEFDMTYPGSSGGNTLAVYDGPDSDSMMLLPPTSGNEIPWPPHPTTLLSSGRTMRVESFIESFPTGPGFRASYSHVPQREEFFLVADPIDEEIFKQNRFGTNSVPLPTTRLEYPVALGYDPVEEMVYYTDSGAAVIGRIHIDGENQEVIATLQVDDPNGLDVDYRSRVVYWTDTGTDTITVSRLDGSYRRIIVDSDLDEPRDIAVHPTNGYIFWTDWGHSRIERSYGDGSHREVIVDGQLRWPNGIYIDTIDEKLYWVDAREDIIERGNFDGTARETLREFDTLHPYNVVVLENAIYWTDQSAQGIEVADRGLQNEPYTFMIGGRRRSRMQDIIYHTREDTPFEAVDDRDCSFGRLGSGCDELCLPIPGGPACVDALPKFSRCPSDFVISVDRATNVSWGVPSASSSSRIDVVVTASHEEGETVIYPDDDVVEVEYIARDAFGQISVCAFNITVIKPMTTTEVPMSTRVFSPKYSEPEDEPDDDSDIPLGSGLITLITAGIVFLAIIFGIVIGKSVGFKCKCKKVSLVGDTIRMTSATPIAALNPAGPPCIDGEMHEHPYEQPLAPPLHPPPYQSLRGLRDPPPVTKQDSVVLTVSRSEAGGAVAGTFRPGYHPAQKNMPTTALTGRESAVPFGERVIGGKDDRMRCPGLTRTSRGESIPVVDGSTSAPPSQRDPIPLPRDGVYASYNDTGNHVQSDDDEYCEVAREHRLPPSTEGGHYSYRIPSSGLFTTKSKRNCYTDHTPGN